MTHKDLLLWVVAGIAIVLSVIAIVAPKGQQSDAAMRSTTMMQAEEVNVPITSGGVGTYGECKSIANSRLAACIDQHVLSDNRCIQIYASAVDSCKQQFPEVVQ